MSDLLLSPLQNHVSDLTVQKMPTPHGKANLLETARTFEGMLMGHIFQTMRKTVPNSGLFGESALTRSTYEYLLDQAVVNHAVESGQGWGLAERLAASWQAKQT